MHGRLKRLAQKAREKIVIIGYRWRCQRQLLTLAKFYVVMNIHYAVTLTGSTRSLPVVYTLPGRFFNASLLYASRYLVLMSVD